MHLRITNLGYHGGKLADELVSVLSAQAGGPRTADVAFDTLIARARASAAARKKE